MASVRAQLQVEILALSESQMPRDFRRQPHSGVAGGGGWIGKDGGRAGGGKGVGQGGQGAGVGFLTQFSNPDVTSGIEFYGLLHTVNIEPQSLEIACKFRRIMGCLIRHALHRRRRH